MLGLWECDCVCLTHAHLDHSGALPAVHEKAPDPETLVLNENTGSNDDEDAAEEAEAALASVDAEFGRTTDPVRMYMREMGTVELLTRQGEIEIAKRIEDGLKQVKYHMAHFPPSIEQLLEVADRVLAGETRMQDFIVGFIDTKGYIKRKWNYTIIISKQWNVDKYIFWYFKALFVIIFPSVLEKEANKTE